MDTVPGERFGRLVVQRISGGYEHGCKVAHCVCDCGVLLETKAYLLRRGSTRSCGCLQKELAREMVARHAIPEVITHGATRYRKQSAEYMVWGGMVQRCANPKHVSYPRYGGRGITVCERWLKFENFYADMGARPTALHTIERQDNDGSYCKDNCSWKTRDRQSRNTRRSRFFTVNGVTMVMEDWAASLGLSSGSAIIHRLSAGWSVERALTQPAKGRL